MTATSPNFILLDSTRPDIANLVAAMLQARNAVKRRSWSHPARAHGRRMVGGRACRPSRSKAERRTAVKQAFYRLADERREIILVACSKCDWRAAFSRDELSPRMARTLAAQPECNVQRTVVEGTRR